MKSLATRERVVVSARDDRGKDGTRGRERVDWWVVVIGPVTLLVVTLGLVAALDLATKPPPPDTLPPVGWSDARDRVEWALATGRLEDARRAWQIAHAAALATHGWSAMLEVGDLALRLAAAGAPRGAAEADARESYVIALLRARRDNVLEGALRAADAFAAIDDAEGVEQALHVADRLASRGGTAERDSYRETAARLRARPRDRR
jgi:hypothetical protein